MMSALILRVEGITKRVGQRLLVEDLSFSIDEGEVFGFLGPNGAGKTTTIRMLVGLIRPSRGEISIAGYSLRTHFKEAIRQVGSIVENPENYTFLTGWENLLQSARILEDVKEEWIRQVVEWVGLSERIHDRVKTYSLGMKERLGIAQALLGRPRLLILDEPTNGLDPAGIRELRGLIRRLVEEERMAVLISSHLLSEVEMLCDRVGIIHHGRMIRVATTRELLQETRDRFLFRLSPADLGEALLRQHAAVREVQGNREDGRFLCHIPEGAVPQVVSDLVHEGASVEEVSPLQVTLEDLFLSMTGGEAGE